MMARSRCSAADLKSFISSSLLAMSGERNAYLGKVGVMEAGALAELLLINGDASPTSICWQTSTATSS